MGSTAERGVRAGDPSEPRPGRVESGDAVVRLVPFGESSVKRAAACFPKEMLLVTYFLPVRPGFRCRHTRVGRGANACTRRVLCARGSRLPCSVLCARVPQGRRVSMSTPSVALPVCSWPGTYCLLSRRVGAWRSGGCLVRPPGRPGPRALVKVCTRPERRRPSAHGALSGRGPDRAGEASRGLGEGLCRVLEGVWDCPHREGDSRPAVQRAQGPAPAQGGLG